jgi:hypothetical protein
MRRNSLPAILLSVLSIVVCGALGAAAGLAVARWTGLSGTPGALVVTLVGMVVATLAFAIGVAVLRRFGAFR